MRYTRDYKHHEIKIDGLYREDYGHNVYFLTINKKGAVVEYAPATPFATWEEAYAEGTGYVDGKGPTEALS